MNLPNKITVFRIILIPVFVTFAVLYSHSLASGMEEQWLRFAALTTFAVASLSDALDGYIARHYHKQTSLGRTLDPVADKLLLLAGVLTLSLTHWQPGLPLWFGVLVVGRDLLIVFGVLIIRYIAGEVKMKPFVSSKIGTALQLSCVCWVLLDTWHRESRPGPLKVLIYLAAIFTVVSGLQYIWNGICQLKNRGETASESES